ncbi:MAG: pyridoxamine 5'-phosphate oxidase family protein, partial [Chloroflexi bacterium]|nr:pyridoxamine 5'-phosphate oxidase family protein [Chloroflexota bacterium]
MLSEKARKFLSENHNGVLTTFRRNGAAQMSIVTCGLYGNGVAFTTTADRAKLLNMKRDPR